MSKSAAVVYYGRFWLFDEGVLSASLTAMGLDLFYFALTAGVLPIFWVSYCTDCFSEYDTLWCAYFDFDLD